MGGISSYHRFSYFWINLAVLAMLLGGCTSNKNELNIIFAGDLIMDRGVKKQANKYGFDHLFKEINTCLKSSEITVANFEGVACDTFLKPVNKKFTFRSNPEWLSFLNKNGITHVGLSNNHSFDYGEEGLIQTVFNLRKHNIAVIGYNENRNSACLPTIIYKNGIKIAIFSSCFLKQSNRFICSESAIELSNRIKDFKANNPSHLIFVNLHWGNENELNPTKIQVEQAHLIIDAGANTIIGHHPHLVQTVEKYKDKFIFYSIGNFIFDNYENPNRQGILTKFTLSNKKIKSMNIIPFNMLKTGPTPMKKKESENFINQILKSPTISN